MDEIKQLVSKLHTFRDEREWEQFHNSKDLAIALSIESSELLELFLWNDNEAAEPNDIQEELADIFSYLLLLASKHDIDIIQATISKIEENEKRYPINKSKGSSKKYTEL